MIVDLPSLQHPCCSGISHTRRESVLRFAHILMSRLMTVTDHNMNLLIHLVPGNPLVFSTWGKVSWVQNETLRRRLDEYGSFGKNTMREAHVPVWSTVRDVALYYVKWYADDIHPGTPLLNKVRKPPCAKNRANTSITVLKCAPDTSRSFRCYTL